MLDWVSSLIVALWPYQAKAQPLASTELSTWVQETTASTLLTPYDALNPSLVAAVETHVAELNRWGWPVEQQGIWFQSGRNVLARHQGTEPLPAASLTKVATTLVALEAWGFDHQFDTYVSYRGSISDGVLTGDLVIYGGGDPFFVWEEAIALGNALNEAGIQTVTGDLFIAGPFTMNFKTSSEESGVLLRQGMNADQWPREAQQQFATLPSGTPRPSVTIQGQVRVAPGRPLQPPSTVEDHADSGQIDNGGASGIVFDGSDGDSSAIDSGVDEAGVEISEIGDHGTIAQHSSSVTHLIHHRSVPLIEMLRQMNIYSNNIMADALADSVGGADAVASRAARITGVPQREIQLINGSGLGVENRLSARAVSAMLMSIQGLLAPSDWSVSDVFPVAGVDEGTIRSRRLPLYSAVKTGSLATVSSLAGAIPTGESDDEVVWFAIINWGSDLDIMRDEQDVLLRGFNNRRVGSSAIARNTQHISSEWSLGAPERNDILAQF